MLLLLWSVLAALGLSCGAKVSSVAEHMVSRVCRLNSSCILMAMFDTPGDYHLKSRNISTISHSQGWVVALEFFTQNLSATLHFLWSKKWPPTPVLLPGKSHGQRSLGGYSPWGHKELDKTEHTCPALSNCIHHRFSKKFKLKKLTK